MACEVVSLTLQNGWHQADRRKKNEAKAQEGTQVCVKEIKFTLWSICGPPQPNDSYH